MENNKLKSATSVMYGIGEAFNLITIITLFVFAIIFATNIINGGAGYASAETLWFNFNNQHEYLIFCEYAFTFCIVLLVLQVAMCVLVHKIYKTMQQDTSGPHLAMLVISVLGGGSIFYILGASFGLFSYNKKSGIKNNNVQ